MQKKYFLHMLTELFDFTEIDALLGRIRRIAAENFRHHRPMMVDALAKHCENRTETVVNVATKFRLQYVKMTEAATDFATDTALQERIRKGATYFFDKLKATEEFVKQLKLTTDNKELQQQINDRLTEIKTALALKMELLEYAKTDGFIVEKYLKRKSEAILGGGKRRNSKREKAPVSSKDAANIAAKLTAWRAQKSEKLGVPAYCIMWNKTIVAIAEAQPTTERELAAIPHLSVTKARKYGKEIIEIVNAELAKCPF